MIVGIKDAAKLFGISIVCFCAVLVCTMFLNFNIDIKTVREEITTPHGIIMYEAQISTAKVVSAVSGGCLLPTSVVMLIFYIKHYIDTHKKELGILKALGYSNLKIAKSFGVFGVSIFIGSVLGFGGAFSVMPLFYEFQNEKGLLPDIPIGFHPSLFICMVIAPTAVFAVLAVCYACIRLRGSVLPLLKENIGTARKIAKYKGSTNEDKSFTAELKSSTLKSRKSLVFFIIFASFCFSAMTQMSFSMKDLSSVMMAVMMITIGLVLACVTLFLAVTAVINGSTKTIAMMRVFGYSQKDCCNALLGGYRPLAYVGFAVGTVYQYVLLRLMVDIVFKDIEGVPEYKFDFPMMFVSLVAFALLYEIVMYCYSERIKRISVKEIMLE